METCRLCVQPIPENKSEKASSKFQYKINGVETVCLVKDFLMKFVDIEINVDVVICSDCMEKLMDVLHFKITCEENDVKWKALTDKSTIKVERDFIKVEIPKRKPRAKVIKKKPTKMMLNNVKTVTEDESECGMCLYKQTDKQMKTIKYHFGDHINCIKFAAQFGIDLWYGETQKTDTISCVICKKSFPDSRAFTKHLNAKEKVTCPVCAVEFSTYAEFNKHIVKTHKISAFWCNICLLPFTSLQRFKTHETTRDHTKERERREWFCNDCNIKFTDRTGMFSHVTEHARNVYDCPRCYYTFNSRVHFRIHLQRKHTFSECKICHKSYSTGALGAHVVNQHKKTPFQCKVCQKIFSTKNVWRVHMRIHVNERKFVCDICGVNFIQLSNMKRHRKTHMSERESFACPQCPRKFSHLAGVRRHEKVKHQGLSVTKKRYCHMCDTKVVHFGEHVRSKKHLEKAKREPDDVVDE